MIVDTVEHIGQIGLWIEAIHLGRLDDRHGARQGLRAGVSASKKPILSSDSNRVAFSNGSLLGKNTPPSIPRA